MSIFNRYKYWIHSAKYTTIQKFVVLFIGIVSFMLLARVLGPEGYGVWGLFMLIAGITETIRNSLIRNAFIWFSHQEEEKEQSRLQAAAFVLSSWISLLLAALYFSLSGYISGALNAPSLGIMLRIYAVTLLVTVLFSHIETVMNAQMDFKGICWMNCVRQGVLLTGILFVFFTRMEITTWYLAVLYLSSVMAGSITGLLMGSRYLHWEISRYKHWLPHLWKFGRYVFGTNIFSQLFRSTDVIITSVLFGPAVSAYYNASQRISNLVDMPSAVLADIMFPKVAKFNTADTGAVKYMYEKAVGATMTFSIPALLIILLFPEMILRFLAGNEFTHAAPVLRVIAFFGFILPFIKQFGTVIDGTGIPHINFRLMLFGFVINIFIILLFTDFWGVLGTAIGMATTYTILFIISQFILYRRFGITVLGVIKQIRLFYTELFHTVKLLISGRKESKI